MTITMLEIVEELKTLEDERDAYRRALQNIADEAHSTTDQLLSLSGDVTVDVDTVNEVFRVLKLYNRPAKP